MAGQRRGQPGRHGHRRGFRVPGLGLLLTLALLLAACAGDPEGLAPFEPGGNTGGASSGGGTTAALVGTWRNVVIVEVPGDIQTWTTVWRFDADGICRQTVETESLAEGFPRITERACEYRVAGDAVTIAYLGAGTVTFDFSFAGFSPDRLLLDGFEYARLP